MKFSKTVIDVPLQLQLNKAETAIQQKLTIKYEINIIQSSLKKLS